MKVMKVDPTEFELIQFKLNG